MKLFTEEQLRRALNTIEFNPIANILIEQMQPIELPSDEEIKAKINSFPYTKHLDDGQYNEGIIEGFEMGVEWIEYYILTQAIHNENRRY